MLGKLLKVRLGVRIVAWLSGLAFWLFLVPWPRDTNSTVEIAAAGSFPILATLALLASLLPKLARRLNAYVWYTLQPWFFESVLSAKFVGAITTILGVYNTAQNIWGKTVPFFRDHPDVHEQAKFWSFVIITIFAIGLFFKERWKESSLVGAESVLRAFLLMVGNVVETKTNRLSEIAKGKPAERRKLLVQLPHLQLQTIIKENAEFLKTSFKLQPDEINISILEKKRDGTWDYYLCHQKWNHNPAADLFKCKSCAAKVLQTGEPVFHPDKLIAEEEGDYYFSARDQAKHNGSIYCVPVTIKLQETTLSFIVSISTYGTCFCAKGDRRNEEKTLNILRQIIRRIELELHQRSVFNPPAP